MTDILAFIAGALISCFWFITGAFFGAAYNRAVAKLDTPDGIITFDLSKIIKLDVKDDDEDESEAAVK